MFHQHHPRHNGRHRQAHHHGDHHHSLAVFIRKVVQPFTKEHYIFDAVARQRAFLLSPRHTSRAMKSPPKVKTTKIAMKSPPKVSKSETTRVRRPKKYKAWCIDKAVRVYKSCELIATEAREKIGPEWTYSWQNVKQLLDISFEVVLGQMKETQDAFELAGLVVVRPAFRGRYVEEGSVESRMSQRQLGIPQGWLRGLPLDRRLRGLPLAK